MPVKRSTGEDNADVPSGRLAFCSDFSATWPDLHDWCTCTVDDRGVKRSPSSFTVFVDDGLWKIVLNDKDTGRSLWVSSKSLWGAFDLLEGHLVAGTGDWRRNREKGGRRG